MQKKYRLQKNWEFQAIIDSKQQIISKNLILYFVKSKELKIGISIPKKFANAVQRNKLRRQVKAALHQINIYDFNYHLVLIVRKPFIEQEFSEKFLHIQRIFRKLGENEKRK